MPESKTQQILHSNEEITNFLICGDARGPKWLSTHPADRDKAVGRLQTRQSAELGTIVQSTRESEAPGRIRPLG